MDSSVRSPRIAAAQSRIGSRRLFQTFTEQAREAIDCAQREAREMGHPAVEPEHLRLELFLAEGDMLSRLWTDFGLTAQADREVVRTRLAVNYAPASYQALRMP